MKNCIICFIPLLALSACQSTTPSYQYTELAYKDEELLNPQWQSLKRYSPRYPIEEASQGREGCATIEYVITPEHEIKDVRATAATSKYFAKESKRVVSLWEWQSLPQGQPKAPVKTSTNFQFCIETGDGHCAELSAYTQPLCQGKDIVPVIGYRVRAGTKPNFIKKLNTPSGLR